MRPLQQLNAIAPRIIHLLQTSSSPSHIHQIQAQIILHRLHFDSQIAYTFINACHSPPLLTSAFSLLTQIPTPPIFISNNLLRALSHARMFRHSLSLYSLMNKTPVPLNHYTFPFILKSIADEHELKLGRIIHTQIVKSGHLVDIYVQNALLNMYASCENQIGECRKVFDEMPERDVVSWTILIDGNRTAGRFEEALIAFQQMQYDGLEPNRVTMVNALAACAGCGALEMGVWIHDCMKKKGMEVELDVILGTALIDMYSTCGKIEQGMEIFRIMERKNIFTWNALIKGLALAESGNEAINWFFRMIDEGFSPDEVTLIAVLNACSHSGMVDIGREVFRSLVEGKYGFKVNVKHYACMVDLLARAGYLEEAVGLMESGECEPDGSMWGSLLDGCRARKDSRMSEFVARRLVEIEPENGAHYAVLSNLYAEMGRWDDVLEIRGLMGERGLVKDFGCSVLGSEQVEMSQ